jgi:hypothetical protein
VAVLGVKVVFMAEVFFSFGLLAAQCQSVDENEQTKYSTF